MLILCLFKFMNMNNLQSGLLFSLTGITAVASLSSCASQKKTEEQKPYNIVYIMTDDHTAQMMSCYDKRYMETPNLDRIANDGVRFTNSFVANSLSGPSRACMITGKHSCANKFYDNTTCIFDGSQQTFPKLLQQAGYQTALIGKWHLESLPTGFNYWEIVPGQGDYYNPSLNPFSLPFILSLFMFNIWGIILVGLATLDDLFHQTHIEAACFYLLGLMSCCIFLYLFFTFTTYYYLGYPCLLV